MCGSAFWITSPSISRTRRSTPCAAGCCGPKFSVKFWISGIAASSRRTGRALLANHLGHGDPRLNADRFLDDAAARRVVAHLDVTGKRKVLAERVADEAVVSEDAAQVRVPAEEDAVEVESLPFIPVGGGPNLDHRIDHRRLASRAEAAQPQARVARHRKQLIRNCEATRGRRRLH